ncbi:MAG: PEF-CTERM sorting domain-containing protein [archaeon]|nr:PEF-CTERM sorting domain-containing protein [archaeon]
MKSIKTCAAFALLLIAGIGMVGTATASPDPGITMVVTQIDNEVLPGETATYQVKITYFMAFPPTEHVVLSIDNPIWSYTFVPNDFDINSGESKYSTLSISVPTDAQPGTYTHIVNATATGQIGPIVITEKVTTTIETTVIPEFTTIAIPVAAILGLVFLFNRRRRG